MSTRLYYLRLFGIMLLIMSAAFLLLSDSNRQTIRNPEDVVWMERIRRNTMGSLEPIRSRISVVRSNNFGIRVGGSLTDLPAIVTVNESERLMGLDIITAAKESIEETCEWEDSDPATAPVPDRNNKKLYEIKDQLWQLTMDYIDLLWLIYSRHGEVYSSRLSMLENQIDTWTGLLEDELERTGLEPVE